MTLHRILIAAKYLNAHFFSVFLFIYALLDCKDVILCKFAYKLG